MNGRVYLVGAGPGDPKLFTLRGVEVMQQADVVVYDRLANEQLLKYAPIGSENIFVGKLPDRHTLPQEEINKILVEKALEGKKVVRLKGGDPFIFARGGEEAAYCRDNNIAFEVVPGVTSAIAAPAYAGIPLTHRESTSSVAIVTGHERPDKLGSSLRWNELATATDTIVFLMGMSNLAFLVKQLLTYGRPKDTPVGVISWGTKRSQQTVVGTLSNIVDVVEHAQIKSPATIVIGEVVRLRDKLSWFENQPLFGTSILVTRARSQSSYLVSKVEELGAEAIEFPVIKIAPPSSYDALDEALQSLEHFNWIIFSSVNGVEYFFRRLRELNIDIRASHNSKIAAIGSKTAEALYKKGLVVNLVPEEFRAERLFFELQSIVKKGDKILLPRADIARKYLAEALENIGCTVCAVDAYSTQRVNHDSASIIDRLQNSDIDIITFTSSSTVNNFVNAIGEENLSLLSGVKVICIGPVTASTAAQWSINVSQVAKTYTIDGLIEALIESKGTSKC